MTLHKDNLIHLIRGLKVLQALDRKFSLSYAVCLMEIAQDEGCALVDLRKKTGLSISTLSRIVGALSVSRQKGGRAFGLVHRVVGKDRRRWGLYLTSKGKKAVAEIAAAMEPP